MAVSKTKTIESELFNAIPVAQRYAIAHHAYIALIGSVPSENSVFFVNPAACEMFGYSEDEFYSLGRFEIFEKSEKLNQFIRERDRKGKAQAELTCIRKNGERFACEVTSVLYNDTDGTQKASNTILDISERKKTSEALRLSNERYKLATGMSFDAIWDADLINMTVHWGDGFKKLFGYDAGDRPVSINTWEDHVHPADIERVASGLNYILEHEKDREIWRDEYRFIRADGSIAYVIDQCLIIRDENGKAVRAIGAMQDVSALKEKEQELLEINNRFYIASQATADIIWDWNLADDMIEWAGNYTVILGHPLPPDYKLPLKFCMGNIHPDDYHRVKDTLEQTIRDQKQIKWEQKFRYRRADNTYAFIRDRGYVVRNAQGNAVRMIGAMQDITTPKYHEDLLSLELSVYEASTNPGISFRQVVMMLLQGIEKIHPDMYTSVLLLKDDDTVKHLPSPRLPLAYTQTIDGLKIGPNEGSCGTAMYRKELVIVSDIENDPLWTAYKSIALQFGLRACWSLPVIHSNGEVMGSLAIYYHKPKEPTEQEWNTVTKCRNILRVLLENHYALGELVQKQKEVSQAIIDTQEKERADIGKELHDNVNQILTTTKLYLDLAATDIGKQQEFLKKSSENILHVINEIRKLSRSLMLPSLGDLGLLESVNDLVDSINLTQKFRIDFIAEPTIEDILTDNQKLIIYRILQESVNNIIKHAEATSVLINISISGDNLHLIVSDDGKGFQTGMVKRGAGLRNIENRVYLFNGTLEINTSPGKGTELVISIPLRKNSSGV